mmetsp:Transcript_43879/g.80415  ORF Transcript_43879/g.80415 Transcript_43879/m.80415 type:complete len:309 (+) Transcript_43879:64-990(+)
MSVAFTAGLFWIISQISADHAAADAGNSESLIPDKILFNYKENLLVGSARSKYPEFQQNLHKTIKLHPHTQVVFYDNGECARAIKRVHSQELREAFEREETGMFKSDICRLAMLWEHGGYYFDNDMEVLTDVRRILPANISLSSVLALARCNRPNAVFQAFVAAMPKHPAIMEALHRTLEWYKQKVYLQTEGVPKGYKRLMGTEVLGAAVMHWLGVEKLKAGPLSRQESKPTESAGLVQTNASADLAQDGESGRNAAYFFEEAEGNLSDFGLIKRNGRGSSCNVYVKDSKNAVAWSRFVGSGEWCEKP